ARMNFLRRRLSDSSFVANLPNGYMMDLQRPDNSTSSPVSPATERKHPQPPQPSQSSPGTSIFSSISSAMKQTTQAAAGLIDHSASPSPPVAQKPKILLVIDDAHTDWAKYFQGKKVNGEFDIRVEQAEFSELNLAAYVTGGCMVDMQVMRNGTKVVREQGGKGITHVSLHSFTSSRTFCSTYLLHNKPLTSTVSVFLFPLPHLKFSQLIKIFSSLGPEKFPLVEQTFFPSHKQMVS
ncbi:SYN3 protein, partial [Bucco capensis]|nr:SYN3 protein [Bucco capensis]